MPRDLRLDEGADAIVLEGASYALTLERNAAIADLHLYGAAAGSLRLDWGIDTTDATDPAVRLDPPTVERRRHEVLVTWQGSGGLWSQRRVELRAWADGCALRTRVSGRGCLDHLHAFGGHDWASEFPYARVFNPDPNNDQVQYFERGEHALITTYQDDGYYGGNWAFTPPPFCFAYKVEGGWLGVGPAAEPGGWRFSSLDQRGNGLRLSLAYDGHTDVDGKWASPWFLFLPAPDEFGAMQRYCDWLRAEGFAPDHGRRGSEPWWREPIFCGWGAQVSLERHGGPRAALGCTQANYERWLAILEAREISPGTVVVDDKWQQSYGLDDVDARKWPDLRGFIAVQHKRGRRVLLWLKAWDPEGLPVDYCIRDRQGQPIAADPGNPDYARRLGDQVRALLGNLAVDGFKIDFTQSIPHGAVGRSVGGEWGLELQRQWLRIISEAAREENPTAMLVGHTANPYLADLVDVLRLNDLPAFDCADPTRSLVPAMRRRARIARAASPYWLLESDNWPCCSRSQWREYVRTQANGELDVPSLYYAERLGWGPTDDALEEEDYAAVRSAWTEYRAKRDDLS